MSAIPTVVFLSNGRLMIKRPNAPVTPLVSPFIERVVDRNVQARQRHGWRSESYAWNITRQMAPVPAGWMSPHPSAWAPRFTSLGRAASDSMLYYVIDTEHYSGLFEYDLHNEDERRLVHRQNLVVKDVTQHNSGQIACSMGYDDGSANIAIAESDGRRLREVTYGDSLDECPAWARSDHRSIYFQSAGLARDQEAYSNYFGPYRIEKLDLDNDRLTTILAEECFDYLLPKTDANGRLLCIRRPYLPFGQRARPLANLLDIVMFPARLLAAIVGSLNYFSLRYTGKPLNTAGGPPCPDLPRFVNAWGAYLNTKRPLRTPRRGARSLVPKTWELIRIESDQSQIVLATGVLGYDLCDDGSFVHTNGRAIWHCRTNGAVTELHRGLLIEGVTAIAHPD